ncbi:hypothetical protein OJF2_53540 [Aquisphaera giovannonii]|uniref:Chromosome partition protein Smc n=1 Tax=Aquisphaera giovannonii TaxID=406548 RepID=A0A5B9W970_9BACT|nr:hypothetical protein [Aquisphaera giovannonii]QEH36769.1 hypothetical protein OJF2_53540 [Aquisphaera giovannonii]
MRELEKPVAQVFRRLRLQRFVATFVWTLALALVAVAVVLAASRFLDRAIPGPQWLPFVIASGVGAFIAAGVAILTGPSRLDAAVAIDRAFHLNERLSTALTLPAELRDTPAGRALMADARRKVQALDVTSPFGLRLPRRAWVVLIPAALAVGTLFLPAWAQRSAVAKTDAQADGKRLAKQTEALTEKISTQRQAIDKDKFPEAEKLLAQIQKQAEDMAKAPPAQKDKLLVQMNKLSDALKERQKQLGSPDQVNRQLQQLKEMGENGPADQLAKDLARGDFKKAEEQIKQLQEKLQKGEMTQAEKKALEQQLGEMAKKLSEAANMAERKKQLDEALKNGGLSKEQYDKEMEKLKQQGKGLQQLSQMASKLGQAQEALKRGDMKQAAESLGMTQQQLESMAKQLEEMQALDGAMADIQDSKNAMDGQGMNQMGQNDTGMAGLDGMRRGMGNGLGRGRGEGDRPEAQDDTATYATKVQQQLRKGRAVLQGLTQPSKTVKGQSVIDIQGEVDAASANAADALTNQKIPRNVEKHIRSYYDQLNKGR